MWEVFRRGVSNVQFAYQDVDQIVNNSVVVVDASGLQLSVKANTKYGGICCFIVNSSGVADWRMTFKTIAGLVSSKFGRNNQLPNAFATESTTYPGSGADRINFMPFNFETGPTGGDLIFQFAQATAEVSDTKLLIGSYLMCVEERP